MTTASIEMRLSLFSDTENDLVVGLDGKTIGRVHWVDSGTEPGFQSETPDHFRGEFRPDAPTALADLFGVMAPYVLERIREIEAQACALRTFEDGAHDRRTHGPSFKVVVHKGDVMDNRLDMIKVKEVDTTPKPLPLPTMPAYSWTPEG